MKDGFCTEGLSALPGSAEYPKSGPKGKDVSLQDTLPKLWRKILIFFIKQSSNFCVVNYNSALPGIRSFPIIWRIFQCFLALEIPIIPTALEGSCGQGWLVLLCCLFCFALLFVLLCL